MPKAFVMINANFGEEKDALETLKKINGIKHIYETRGVYDFLVEVVAENIDKLQEIVTWQIRRIPAVRSTLTSIVVED